VVSGDEIINDACRWSTFSSLMNGSAKEKNGSFNVDFDVLK
jgi:hypothetical protein